MIPPAVISPSRTEYQSWKFFRNRSMVEQAMNCRCSWMLSHTIKRWRTAASAASPSKTTSTRCAVKEVIFPVAGEQTLRDLQAEYKQSGFYDQRVQMVMRGSYSNHYRRMVPHFACPGVLRRQLCLRAGHYGTGTDAQICGATGGLLSRAGDCPDRRSDQTRSNRLDPAGAADQPDRL